MRSDETLVACDLKSSCHKEGLATPVFAPDKFCVPPTLCHVIELPADDPLLNIKADRYPLTTSGRHGPDHPMQRVRREPEGERLRLFSRLRRVLARVLSGRRQRADLWLLLGLETRADRPSGRARAT